MSPETPRPANIRELESLRIARSEPIKRSRLLPALIVFLVLALFAVGGYQVYLRTYGKPIEVQTATVTFKSAGTPGTLLTGSGYIVTKQKYITIGAQVIGQIVEEPIQEGQHVKPGDLLARIDNRDYVAQLNQATADRDLAKANVELTRAQLARKAEMFKEHTISKDDYDIALNAYNVAVASLARAEGAIKFAQFNVSQCVIRSPIDGIVLQKYREVGSMISYGNAVTTGYGIADIAQLADTTDMRAEVDVNESDIAKVAIGAPATVTLDAYGDRPFEARVVKIYPEADRQKGTVKVEVHLENPDLSIVKPEMSAKVTFDAVRQSAVQQPLVLVPKKALVGEGAGSYVWVVRDSRITQVPVVTGREFQDGLEVKQGLSGGETVIVVPPPKLNDGQLVTPVAS